MSEIIVTGSVQGTDATVDALLEAALTHVRRSRTEPGCLSHHVFRDAEDPNRLFFFERWRDHDALKAHFAVPESRLFARELANLSASKPRMTVYRSEEVK